MSQNKNYYAVLGLERIATEQDIKKAYRKLAQTYHPDVNKDPGAEAKMKEINEAYAVLGDAKQRQQYDYYTQSGYQQPYSTGNTSYQTNTRTYSSFEEMLADMLRQQQAAQQQYQNQYGNPYQQAYRRQEARVFSFYRFLYMIFLLRLIVGFFMSLFR